MKKIYHHLVSVLLTKSLLLAVLFLGVAHASNAQIYRANNLSGPNESPPVESPGTGEAVVTITGTSMRVQATFSGLLGPTISSHIHAPTAIPGQGTAGVATAVPSFPGFPLGVTDGTYDVTFDMTLASSYNPAYVTANGGTTASAFDALKTALNNGTAYFNIHSTFASSGEIRAFFISCPTLSVSIPDAFALPHGVLPNTVYPGYSPAASLTLATSVSGGTGPYTYEWSNGSTASSATVSPVVPTQYSVVVRDQNGCPGEASKTVEIADVAGGKKKDKVVICHKGNTLTVDMSAVAAHLAHGDRVGSCMDGTASTLREGIIESDIEGFSVLAFPNPSLTYFDVKISGKAGREVQVKVFDLFGRVIESRDSVQPNQLLQLGNNYSTGIYIMKVVQGSEKQTLKLLKVN